MKEDKHSPAQKSHFKTNQNKQLITSWYLSFSSVSSARKARLCKERKNSANNREADVPRCAAVLSPMPCTLCWALWSEDDRLGLWLIWSDVSSQHFHLIYQLGVNVSRWAGRVSFYTPPCQSSFYNAAVYHPTPHPKSGSSQWLQAPFQALQILVHKGCLVWLVNDSQYKKLIVIKQW